MIENAYSTEDPISYSNPTEAIVTHIHLDWKLDFDNETISGAATLSVSVLKNDSSNVYFDSRGLSIKTSRIGDVPANHSLSEDGLLGQKVTVPIPNEFRTAQSCFDITFEYSTSPGAMAVQWLKPAATAGKVFPYVFTQCQAIHARTLFPCMDSPGVKTTYTATVTAPEWCTVLMSALALPSVEGDAKGTFRWTQPVPVCSYLIALAAGELASRDVSPRVRIWAEPTVVADAANDFSQTEEFLSIAEGLTCPYLWTRYDVLCLPPSFPYGGMENPCLTFATPTLLTGDKSLADVIAHEIAHSWTGNLVTNKTWEHFWLNEGWTVWLERKIVSRMYDNEGDEKKDHLLLSAEIGWKTLQENVSRMGETDRFTRLVWPLANEDPDDAFSSVPYEKGFNLLYQLETKLGTPAFETFAKAYIQEFQFGYVTSGSFKDFLLNHFAADEEKSALLLAMDWKEIFYGTGMPKYVPDFSNRLSEAARTLASVWTVAALSGSAPSTASSDDIKGWTAKQVCVFLELLLDHVSTTNDSFPEDALQTMDGLYDLTASGNAEIKFRWLSLCIESDVTWIVPHAVSFVTSQGRMKFVRPLYRSLRASPVGSAAAIATFATHSDMYHPIAKKMIQVDFAAAAQADAAADADAEA
eukprot:gene6717-13611_t